MPLVQEVVDWAIVNADNIKPIPPSPAGKPYPSRPNLSLQEMMGAIARWRDDIDAAIAAAGLTVTPTPAADQLVIWDDAGTTVSGDPNLTWNGTSLGVTGNVTITGGTFNSRGIDDNATAERQQLSDFDVQWGDGGATETWLQSMRGSTSGSHTISGGNSGILGAAITMFGQSHSGNPGDMHFMSSNANFMQFDESESELLVTQTHRLVAGDAAATTGATVIEGAYSGTSRLFVAGSTRSAGRSYLARGVRADAVTAGGYESSADNVAFARSAFECGGDAFYWRGAASATVAIGTDVVMTQMMNLTTTGLQIDQGALLAADDLIIQPQTLTADNQHDVVLFSNTAGTAAQSGGFSNRLRLYGGGGQTRTLDLYQDFGGNAHIDTTYTSNILEINSFNLVEADQAFKIRDNVGGAVTYSGGQLELYCSDGGTGGIVSMGFHRGGLTACQLRHESDGLILSSTSQTGAARFRAEGVITSGSANNTGIVEVNAAATGSPYMQWLQNGAQKAYIQYLDSGDIFAVFADGEFQIRPFNSTEFTLTASAGIFEANLQVKGQAWSDTQTLTQAATIAWNCDLGNSAVTTMTGNRTLGAPTNQRNGATYTLRVIQDGTGTRTLAYNAVFKWPGGTAPVLSTGAGDIDVLTFVSDGTNMYGVINKDFT